ncbi:predicted protein [Nematostella vectensis]|uniref:Uncharacterized protein n=1 Tax=Nematostella vectensis TaxID=45351 RepID=A7SXG2_NEMVE|nr:predicted protein [Nematostella vectensis]|eukprot:XP_001623700.1 predicted protein [Nematostella vectensis]
MESSPYSVSAWRKKKKEKKVQSKREYYEKNREELAEKAKERMRKLRAKRAAKPSVQTRNEKKRQAPKDRNTASVLRAKIRKQEEELRKETQRKQARNRMQELRKRKLAEESGPEPEVEFMTPAFSSRMTRKRAKDKVSPSLPTSPAKKAEVLENLVNSPRTKKILERKNVLRTDEDKKKAEAVQSLLEDMSEGLSKVKQSKAVDERAAYSAARSLAFGSSIKKNRHQQRVAQMVGIKRQQVSKAIAHREKVLKGDTACWLVTRRNVRSDAVKEEDKRLICDYWSNQASRPTGAANDKVRQRTTTTTTMIYFPSMTCMKFRKQAKSNDVCTFEFLTQAADSTLCEREEESKYHATKCLTRECENCGTYTFKTSEEENSTETQVKWKRYEYVTYEDKNGEEKKKIALVSKETSVKAMFDYFLQLLKEYPYHSFMAKWQKKQFGCLDYHFVHHTQELILKYLRDDLKVPVEKVNEFTDGCAGQYKSKHTFGDLSCCLSDFGCQIDRHFFETSHAKGEQDAAGANIKQRATLAVIRGRATIKSAKQLHDYLSSKFTLPTTSNTSLSKRIYFHIPVKGEGAVARRSDRTFKELKGIRKLHSVKTTPVQCKISTRLRSCLCFGCIEGEECENREFVDEWKEIILTREEAVATTRQNQESGEIDMSVNGMASIVKAGSVVAIAAEDDNAYDYYLFKVSSDGAIVLNEHVLDDYNAAYQKGLSFQLFSS